MKKKILFAFTAVLMSSLYGGINGANATTALIEDAVQNEVSFDDNEGPPQDPLEDIETTSASSDDEIASLSDESYDPLEPINRITFMVNQILDGLILRPTATIYRAVFPEPVRDSVTNVLSNLWEPVSFVNHVLQGNPSEAGIVITRFVVNTTIGLAGIFDMAKTMDLPSKATGFDDTLAVWGITSGPYLILPVLGPSTLRGAAGLTADYFTDPFNYYLTHKKRKHKQRWLAYTRTGIETIDQRHRLLDTLDELEESSIDFYATMRSIHFQRLAYKQQPQSNTKKQR